MKILGITSSSTENRTFLNSVYHSSLTRDGVGTVALPNLPIPYLETTTQEEFNHHHKAQIEEYAARLDALVLSGGVDLQPVLYDEANWGAMSCDSARDMTEYALIDAFVRAGKPIFGICRGLQSASKFLNLPNFHQDLGMTKELHQAAEREFKDRAEAVHSVYVFGAYRDYARLKTGRADLETMRSTSHHHQGLTLSPDGKVPKQVKTHEQYANWFAGAKAHYEEQNEIDVIASTLMVIEGLEKPDLKMVLVQGHPEELNNQSLAIRYWTEKYVLA